MEMPRRSEKKRSTASRALNVVTRPQLRSFRIFPVEVSGPSEDESRHGPWLERKGVG